MLTFLKQIFVWWNRQTIGTKLYTIFYGKYVGKDYFGKKYQITGILGFILLKIK